MSENSGVSWVVDSRLAFLTALTTKAMSPVIDYKIPNDTDTISSQGSAAVSQLS